MKSATSKTLLGNSVVKEKTTTQKNAPCSVNSKNPSKCPKVSSNSTKEKNKSSKPAPCSKIPTRLQSKLTVQPGNNVDRKIDDKRKNSKLTPKSKTINLFNSKETFQSKKNKTNSHLSQKEFGPLKKASLTQNNLSKNVLHFVSETASSSKEGIGQKREEEKRTVYPKKTLANKSILKRISKSDLNLNIHRTSEEKEIMNRNARKVSESLFSPRSKKVTFKYSSVNDLKRLYTERDIKTNLEDRSVFKKTPFSEHLSKEVFVENSNKPDFFGQSFVINDNINCTETFESPNETYMQAKRRMSNFLFDGRFEEDISIVKSFPESPVLSFYDDDRKFPKNMQTVLSPGLLEAKESQVITYSKDSNDSDQGSFLDPNLSVMNPDIQNGLQLLERYLTGFENTIVEGKKLNSESWKSEGREIYQDCISERIQNIEYISEQKQNNEGRSSVNLISEAQCLMLENKSNAGQLRSNICNSPLHSNLQYAHRHESIFSDPITEEKFPSGTFENNSPLKELSKRNLIEKSIEEKIRILKYQFLKQIKEQNKKYYLFQKKVDQPTETGNDFVDCLVISDTKDSTLNKNIQTKDDEFQLSATQDGISSNSDKEHYCDIKKAHLSLSNLLLDYYDQHIKSATKCSISSSLEGDLTTSTNITSSPKTVESTAEHLNTEDFSKLSEIHPASTDIASNSSVITTSLKSESCKVDNTLGDVFVNDSFSELDDDVRKFEDFFGKVLIEEEELVEILKTYFLDEEVNSSVQSKQSHEEAKATKKHQIFSNKKINRKDSFMMTAVKFVMLPLFVFTCILYFVEFKINTEVADL